MPDDVREVVCYGDSNTWGADPGLPLRLGHGQRWTTILGEALGSGYEVIAEGLGGRTAGFDDPDLPDRNGRDQLLACLWSHAPIWAVVIMLGTNDTKAVFHATAAQIADHVETLIGMIEENVPGPSGGHPRILLMAPPPLGAVSTADGTWDESGRCQSMLLGPALRVVAERHGARFLDAAEVIESSPQDGVHLDPDATRILGLEVAARLR